MIPVKSLLKIMTKPAYRQFMASLNNPHKAQQKIFSSVLCELSSCAYGRSLKVSNSMSYEEFAQKVPIVSYEDIGQYIENSMHTNKSPLLASTIVSYETTSGSSGKNKIIPYSQAAMRAFQKMAAIWVHDTLKSTPELCQLKVFYAISPPRLENLGFTNDEEYLGFIGKLISRKFSAVPRHLSSVTDFKTFRFLLSLHLLACSSLEIIYIWSPSYLISLLEFIEQHQHELQAALKQGYYVLDGQRYHLAEGNNSSLLKEMTIPWEKIWPHLRVISCWTDAQAAGFCEQLREVFPHVKIQPKGLLATEAAMTIKVDSLPAAAPFVDEIFFEFLSDHGIHRLEDLQVGHSYEVILSNLSGLYRYRTHDVVKVTDYYGSTPLMRFMGRANRTSDMVGEKITEALVEDLQKFSLHGCNILIPDYQNRDYVLLTSDKDHDRKIDSQKIDRHLSTNYHYAYARNIGQLKPPRVIFVPHISKLYEQYYLEKGMKWGDIKFASLITKADEADALLLKVPGTPRGAQ